VSDEAVPLLPPAPDGGAAQRDSLEHFTLTFRALPSSIPARIRVRQFLKVALRAFGLVNEGFLDGPRDAQGGRQGTPAARDGSGAVETSENTEWLQ
jgi:hypothetical protein